MVRAKKKESSDHDAHVGDYLQERRAADLLSSQLTEEEEADLASFRSGIQQRITGLWLAHSELSNLIAELHPGEDGAPLKAALDAVATAPNTEAKIRDMARNWMAIKIEGLHEEFDAFWPLRVVLGGNGKPCRLEISESESQRKSAEKANSSEVDFSLLATRDQLISAFGPLTGMTEEWFKNLTNSADQLHGARKIKGKPGRGGTEPWFCPYEVMLWLTSKNFKKSQSRITQQRGYALLKANFKAVYALHEHQDPSNF